MCNIIPDIYGFTCIISVPIELKISRNIISRAISFADIQHSNAYQIKS